MLNTHDDQSSPMGRPGSQDGFQATDSHGASGGTNPLLKVRNLSTHFYTREGVLHAVDDVSFDLYHGETLGLVGESGCGKTVTALSIVKLVPDPPGRIVGGQVILDGVDLMPLSNDEIRLVRGKTVGFIFQDPMTSLNPTHTIGRQIGESARIHLNLSRKESLDRAVDLLHRVGIPRARERAGDYPHQFSGGMRQRVMIALAIACEPALLLADEPTTALDVTIQAQILELIGSLSAELGTAVILITHDLGIAAGMCDRINVMYAGQIVESGSVDEIFDNPRMPYTSGLLDSLPRLGESKSTLLKAIEGLPPDLVALPPGCRFSARCRHASETCLEQEPDLTPRGGMGQRARCWGTEPGGWI